MRFKSFFATILALVFLVSLGFMQTQAADVLDKEVRIGATQMFPDQSNTPTKGDTGIGNQGYVFATGATDSLHAYVPLPLDMCEDSHIEPYVLFAQNATESDTYNATNANAIKLRLSHTILDDAGNSTVTDDARTFEVTNATMLKGAVQAFKFNQIGTQGHDPGDVLHLEFSRIGGDSADNATKKTVPLGLELHYQECVGGQINR